MFTILRRLFRVIGWHTMRSLVVDCHVCWLRRRGRLVYVFGKFGTPSYKAIIFSRESGRGK